MSNQYPRLNRRKRSIQPLAKVILDILLVTLGLGSATAIVIMLMCL